MKSFTVAVLECDTPIAPVLESHGTYGDILRRFLQRGLAGHATSSGSRAPELKTIETDMVEMGNLPSLDDVDCVLLSGSKHNSFENDAWILRTVDYVRKAFDTGRVLVIGICFGHQIIGRALGGYVQRSPGGWEVSVENIDLTETGIGLFGTKQLCLHQMHRDAVLHLPKTVLNIGTSPACGIQGLYIPGRILSVQAHPEFDEIIMQRILDLRYSQGVFDDTLFQHASHRAKNKHDGDLVGQAIWRFLLADSK